tara:strand:- start:3931 stop:4068 length:138 start_codon:yes stop_codon:yes gene_type:complete
MTIAMDVRCPACGKKLAEHLEGKLTIRDVKGCGQTVTIDNRVRKE